MENGRRRFLKKMGVAGSAVATVSIAGCSGGGGDDDRRIEQDLPEERRVEEKGWIVNTERYYPERYQAVVLGARRLRESIGFPVSEDPLEITRLDERRRGDYDMITYNFGPLQADPDSVLVDRLSTHGADNHTGFDHERFDEVVLAQRRETDSDARQELVYEAQRILGEQRPENQLLYNQYNRAFNSDRIDPDSVVNHDGLNNILNWTSMEPLDEDGQVLITNNWDPTEQLNPLHHNTVGPDRNFTPMSFIHDFLVRLNPDQQPQPWAASDWEWSDDTTVVVTMKEDMVFHDGESVTADDVVYTFDLIFRTEPPAYTSSVNDVLAGVEKTGDLELTFDLEDPYAPFVPVTLGTVPILPQHYWENLISETGSEETPWEISIDDDTPLVGSGPFQWGTWDQGTRFRMPAFKDHPFAAPNIEMRIQRPLSTRDAELQALRQGEYDLLDYWFGPPNRLHQTVEENDHLTEITYVDTGRQAAWVNTRRPPFDDVAFRQAINAVLMQAQETIIREIYDGYGERAISPISSALEFWHNPETPIFGPGEDAAVSILEDAGYVWNEDGALFHPE